MVGGMPTAYVVSNLYVLESGSGFNYLEIIFDSKLRFNIHLETCVNKAKSLLGFIERRSKELDYPYIAKKFYMCLDRFILKYCIVLLIESVQR